MGLGGEGGGVNVYAVRADIGGDVTGRCFDFHFVFICPSLKPLQRRLTPLIGHTKTCLWLYFAIKGVVCSPCPRRALNNIGYICLCGDEGAGSLFLGSYEINCGSNMCAFSLSKEDSELAWEYFSVRDVGGGGCYMVLKIFSRGFV